MNYFTEMILSVADRSCEVGFLGYSECDIEKIKRLYNVEVKGQFRDFLMIMGRCDGGLFGDSKIRLYRQNWNIRSHLLFQVVFFDLMQEDGFFHFLKKPFAFCLLAETQYYFLQTSLADSDVVYHYDSNESSVKATEWDLIGFLKMLITDENELGVASVGDLLRI